MKIIQKKKNENRERVEALKCKNNNHKIIEFEKKLFGG